MNLPYDYTFGNPELCSDRPADLPELYPHFQALGFLILLFPVIYWVVRKLIRFHLQFHIRWHLYERRI